MMRIRVLLASLTFVALGVASDVAAQASPSTSLEAIAAEFEWREVGPANPSGRIVDVEAVAESPHIIYAGTASGGLWRTVNAGTTWEPIFDDQPTASIGDIGLSSSNPNILYVGTGEVNNRNSSPWGAGVFKSTDAGDTWTYVGLKETRHIGRVIVHPTNPDIVWVAAMGHLWGANEERGVFKTTDGGTTWDKILYWDDRTGATDLTIDPVNPDILYAVAHERTRDRFDGGDPVDQWGPSAGIYITKNGGQDWTRSTNGLPTVEMGRAGISASAATPGVVYALVSTQPPPPSDDEDDEEQDEEPEPLDINRDGVFKTTDYGETWVKVNDWNNRPSYYSQIRADPNDADVFWAFASPMAYSDDGGDTVVFGREVQGSTHIDYHSGWIDPANSDHVIVGGDGGVNITWDRGKNWEVVQQMGLAQAYAITADMRKPYYLVVGLQDNGIWVGASRGRMTKGVTNNDWFPLSNSDGFVSQVDPTDFNTIYAETQGGGLYRQDLRTGQNVRIKPQPPEAPEGEDGERYRFDWNTPYLLSPHNSETLYMGANKVFKSVDRGDNWTEISGDLTADADGERTALVSLTESTLEPGMLWAGSNDGNVWLRRDESHEWEQLNDNISGAPDLYWVKRIEASHHDAARAFLVLDGHRWDDVAPYIYVTDDYGQSWTNITNNLPEGSIYVVREDAHNPDLLFAGSEVGLYFSIDRGATWARFMTGLPTVPVHDLLIHPRDQDLIAGTHGRGAWIAGNITPLQQLSEEVMASDVHLFEVRPETQWLSTYEFSWTTDKRFYKDNPPTGSNISFFLGSTPSDSVTVEILDISGEVLRELKAEATAGLNSVFWNQRGPTPPADPDAPRRFFRGPRQGPLIEPGEYLVRLTVGDVVQTTRLIIEKDVPGYMGR